MIDIGLEEQTKAFLFAVTMGLAFGLFYDLLRGIRGLLGRGKWLTAILDLFYSVVCCGVFFVFTLTLSLEQIRFFSLGGCAGGMVLYFSGISPTVAGAFQKLEKGLRRLLMRKRQNDGKEKKMRPAKEKKRKSTESE